MRGGRWNNHRPCGWRQWQDNPEDDVREEAGSGTENREQPNHANDGRIEIEIIRESGAYTADLLIPAGAHQPFPRLGPDRTRRSPSRIRGELVAAAVTEFGAVRDFLLAVRAKHVRTPAH